MTGWHSFTVPYILTIFRIRFVKCEWFSFLSYLGAAFFFYSQLRLLLAGCCFYYFFFFCPSRHWRSLSLKMDLRATCLGVWARARYSHFASTDLNHFCEYFPIGECCISTRCGANRGWLNYYLFIYLFSVKLHDHIAYLEASPRQFSNEYIVHVRAGTLAIFAYHFNNGKPMNLWIVCLAERKWKFHCAVCRNATFNCRFVFMWLWSSDRVWMVIVSFPTIFGSQRSSGQWFYGIRMKWTHFHVRLILILMTLLL